MRRHRRTAPLTSVAWTTAAAAVGVSALLVPRLRGGLAPTLGDVATGWAFLAASYVVVRRQIVVASCLFAAGATWIGVGLAPMFQGPVADVVLRLALFPSALLVIAMGSPNRAGHHTPGASWCAAAST